MDDRELMDMAERLAAVDGVVGVCLGGSRARGTHRPDSDYDLGLYYRGGSLDVERLRELARELTRRRSAVTDPGGWGPWVDGGAWLDIRGARVDWIYRDVDRVRTYTDDCLAGRYEHGTQAGHPFGVHSHAYVGELALGRVLADPTGELGALRGQVAAYPEKLRAAIEDNARFEVPFTLACARKGAARGDAFYVHGCLFRAVGLLAHALHARAGEWLINEKGAVDAAGRLPGAPPHFAERAHALFTTGGTALDEVLDAADELAEAVLS